MTFTHNVGGTTFVFPTLKTLLAKASPLRAGDRLAGIGAESAEECVAAKLALANVPLKTILAQPLIPYEDDEVTRLIIDTHDTRAFAPIAHMTVGELREHLLSHETTPETLAELGRAITPEFAAAVSKLMRNQDLILAARKCRITTAFRNTIGLPGTMAVRLQPNHPTDDPAGIMASIADGLLYGCGDAVIGINPATDQPARIEGLLRMLDDLIQRYAMPAQACVLGHVTTTLDLIAKGVPVDLVFQSIGGTEKTNRAFGITLDILREADSAARALKRGTVGNNVMYFETGQGSALSADAHHGIDQQTCEARAYAVARAFSPLLVNTVVGFIGPEYLYDGKEILRAALEDHFCGKLMGLPMGVDVCYTNHAEADQDDMDVVLTALAAAGVTYIMGVPGADDVMLGYQSTSFHDALYVREAFGLKRAPEFAAWLVEIGIANEAGRLLPPSAGHRLIADARSRTAGWGPGVMTGVPRDPWAQLDWRTSARIAIGRAGASLPTREVLSFALAHARARDAVHAHFDRAELGARLESLGLLVTNVESQAGDRSVYLRRPDLGRRLKPASRERLAKSAGEPACDLALMIGDGLSANAVAANAPPMIEALLPFAESLGLTLGPVVIAEGARVALGDEVGEILGARLIAVLIGERPGLSAADSLSIYLTYAPQIGRTDAERNCISNIRPGGLASTAAAANLAWLIEAARAMRMTGIGLKDQSGIGQAASLALAHSNPNASS